MSGPQPKPTALKLLDGNPGKRPLNDREPQPLRKLPACPKHIQGEARAEWRRTAKALHGCGLLTEIDRAALEAYCVTYARWLEAEANIREFGAIVMAPKTGVPMVSPYMSVARQSLDQMTKLLAAFGMTPASRSRISAAAPEQDDRDKWGDVLG